MIDKLGTHRMMCGAATTLNPVRTRTPAQVEAASNLEPGTLAHGFLLYLLAEPMHPEDFDIAAITKGMPGTDRLTADPFNAGRVRESIHAAGNERYGEEDYRALLERATYSAWFKGLNRIARVLPLVPVEDGEEGDMRAGPMPPMVTAGVTWRILPPGRRFLLAMQVDAQGVATTRKGSFDLTVDDGGDIKMALEQYLLSV